VIVYLKGFYPAEREEDLIAAAQKNGWGYQLEEVADDDNPPTLLRNPKWVDTIKPILDMVNLLPGYKEIDISPLFLLFFCLFFGILVGDAGYGTLFLSVTLWARFKSKSANKTVFNLLIVTSVSTIIWGALTGVWFGILNLPALLKNIQITWLSDYYNMMGLCFVIGAIHLTIAHLWKAWTLRKTPRCVAQIGWIGSTWSLLFIALNMVCKITVPSFVIPLFSVSAILIILFMTPPSKLKEKWIDHGMLVQDFINNFVDIFSYVRLFAVGLATFEVAKAFNGMATGFIAPIVLLIGHTLNIAMAVMGVMVHGLRLNALEFSSHIGVEWTGNKFTPFKKKTITQNKQEEYL
jgi:V/A-type H+-transporting ATPase subunit I